MSLKTYQSIPMAFTVDAIWEPIPPRINELGFAFQKKAVDVPYIKDYDEGIDPKEGLDWARRWDVSNWGFLAAYDDETLVGCAAVVWDSVGVSMLEGRKDITILWDIRVALNYRGKGVGSALLETAVNWSRARNVVGMKIETQNINVKACQFYAAKGCQLVAINTLAYPTLPNEIQLIWFLPISES